MRDPESLRLGGMPSNFGGDLDDAPDDIVRTAYRRLYQDDGGEPVRITGYDDQDGQPKITSLGGGLFASPHGLEHCAGCDRTVLVGHHRCPTPASSKPAQPPRRRTVDQGWPADDSAEA